MSTATPALIWSLINPTDNEIIFAVVDCHFLYRGANGWNRTMYRTIDGAIAAANRKAEEAQGHALLFGIRPRVVSIPSHLLTTHSDPAMRSALIGRAIMRTIKEMEATA